MVHYLAGGGQAAGLGVHAEEHDGVGILVGGEEIAAGGVERESRGVLPWVDTCSTRVSVAWAGSMANTAMLSAPRLEA